MTDCTTQPLLFASVDRRQIVADFRGGDLTSDGGLPLLREVDRRIGLIDALDAAIDDPRCPWLIEHDQQTILAQRIFALAAGYEDLNDHQALRNDTLLAAMADRRFKGGHKEGDPLSSPPTLCRLENRVTRADLVRMSEVLVETLRRVAPARTELARAQVGTIRLKLLKIGGRIVRSIRRIVIHLASGFPLQDTLKIILRHLRDWRCAPAP